VIFLLDFGIPRDAMMPRAPETEALHGVYAPIEPRDPRVDGSPVPLGSTATNETIGLETLWVKKQSSTNKRISATINNHRETSG
jgi:hypothetical protein